MPGRARLLPSRTCPRCVLGSAEPRLPSATSIISETSLSFRTLSRAPTEIWFIPSRQGGPQVLNYSHFRHRLALNCLNRRTTMVALSTHADVLHWDLQPSVASRADESDDTLFRHSILAQIRFTPSLRQRIVSCFNGTAVLFQKSVCQSAHDVPDK